MRKVVLFGSSLVLAVVAMAFLTAGRSTQAQAVAPGAVVRWEYSVIRGFRVETFNELGAQGWELCAAGSNLSQYSDYVFKRPKR
ncbi:hypothetical protein EP7_002183 [Isosphaeraceae bacterium EP7]